VDLSPRLDARLVEAIRTLDDRRVSIAETRRRVGTLAASLGLPRPSYERVRQLVHEHRRQRARSRLEPALDLVFNTRPADAVVAELLSPRRTDRG
jgi:hypothetical protein